MNICDAFPTPEDFVAADVQRRGSALVRTAQYQHGTNNFTVGTFVDQVVIAYGSRQRPVMDALAEALIWAQTSLLVIPDIGQQIGSSGTWLRLSDAGRSFADEHLDLIRLRRILPEYLLHPTIRASCLPIYLTGRYEAAVFEAFKQVEAATREAAGFGKTAHGASMITDAFHAETGPLRLDSEVSGERQGLQLMMTGMIQLLKNPRSHRNTDVTDPVEAAEMMMIASFGMRRIESAPKRKKGPAAP